MTISDYKIPRPASDIEDYDLFWAIVEPMWDALDFYEEPERAAKFFRSVSPAHGGMIALWWCRSEVCNGGFHQFFGNSTGMIWPQALDGFKLVGAVSHAALLEKALQVFPGGLPPLERNRREEFLELNEHRSHILDPLDTAFYVLERDSGLNLDSICAKYIRSRPGEFFRDST